MNILINDAIDKEKWNRLVGDNTFHRFEWKDIITDTYGLKPYYLLIEEGENFALLPSFKIKNKLVSLPYTYIVGFIYNSEELLSKINKHIKDNNFILQYKHIDKEIKENSTVTAIIETNDSNDFLKSLPPNMRNQIRKSKKSNLTIQNEKSVDNFYAVYAKKMHALGTPAHPKKFFLSILSNIKDSYVYTVFYEKEAIASMFCIVTNDVVNKNRKTLNITWAAANSAYDKLYANYFLYYEVIDDFMKKGIESIDLGTCKINSSQYRFKKKWNPIFYAVTQTNTSSHYKDNKKMILISHIWKKLPFGLVNLIGPKLRKYLV